MNFCCTAIFAQHFELIGLTHGLLRRTVRHYQNINLKACLLTFKGSQKTQKVFSRRKPNTFIWKKRNSNL